MVKDWIRSKIMEEFEEFMVAIYIDESVGNYEMRFSFFELNKDKFEDKIKKEFMDKDIKSIKSKSLNLFYDEVNNYIIDNRLDFSNLIISREDRTGELEEEVYGLFAAYNKIKCSLKKLTPELYKFDNYLKNFGIENLMDGKTDILVYNQFEKFAFSLMENKKDADGSRSPQERIIEILGKNSTKEEITDLMLEDITRLKNSVKKGDNKEMNLYSENIRNYSKIIDYDPTNMLEGIIKK